MYCNECVSTECNVHKDNKCSCFDECVCGDVCDCDEPNACHTTKEEEYAEKLEKAKEYVEKNLNKGVEKLKEVYDRVEKSDAVKQGKDKLAELYDKVEHSDAVKQGKDKISEIYDKVEHSDVVMRSKDAAKGVYSKLEDSEFFKKANDTLSKLVEYSKKSELSLNVEEARKAFLNTLKDELDRRKKLEEEESGETEVPPIEVPNVSTDDNRTSPLKTTEEYINDLMKAAANNATPKSDVRADINRFAKESHDLKREITRRPEGSKKVIKIETKDNPSCE